MKIMFVYSVDDVESMSKPFRNWHHMQFGISYISAVLKAQGHQSCLLVIGSNTKWKNIANLLKNYMVDFDPHLVCFTAVASQFPFVRKIADHMKTQWPDVFLIVGGVHSTLNPSELIQSSFDALCIGEGEEPLLELCDQIKAHRQPSGIANLWIKSPQGTIEKNPTRPFRADIDRLPFPDRAMWEPWIPDQCDSGLTILLGRGCPYACTYCCNHALKKVASGQYVRMRSPSNVIEEIALLHKQYPNSKQIYFEVESIALNKNWFFEMCKQLEVFNLTINSYINYSVNFRISRQSADENIFAALKRANFSKISIGLESGSERIRRDVLKRDYSNKDFLDVVDMAQKYGLAIGVYNMIGLPGETTDSHKETIHLNRKCQPADHFTGIFYPYPGTELYDSCLRNGFIKEQIHTQLERRQPSLDFPDFTRVQIRSAYTWFNYHVYKGYKPLWWIFIQVIRARIGTNSTANLVFRKFVQLPILRDIRQKLENS